MAQRIQLCWLRRSSSREEALLFMVKCGLNCAKGFALADEKFKKPGFHGRELIMVESPFTMLVVCDIVNCTRHLVASTVVKKVFVSVIVHLENSENSSKLL
ncbi:unnamed protein product [Caenorhabditis brenneri]